MDEGTSAYAAASGANVDFTHRALDERCALYESMLRVISDIVLCVNRAQRIVFANIAASKAFGYPLEEFNDLPLAALVPETAQIQHAKHVQAFMEDPGPLPRVMALGQIVMARRKNATTFLFELTLTQLTHTEGGPWVAAVGRDVTEQQAQAQRLMQQRAQLQHRAIALQSLREAERARIARALHEDLSQSIATMGLDIAWMQSHAHADMSGLDQRLSQMRECADQVVRSLRKLSAELRPLMLDDLGLSATLEWLAHQVAQRYGVRIEVSCTMDDALRLSEPVHSSLYRVAEEVLHYLGATRSVEHIALSVVLDAESAAVQMCASPMPAQASRLDVALIGVHERVEVLGGRIEVHKTDKNLTIQVNLPAVQDVL